MASGGREQEAPIGELVGRLLDDGKAYAKAEFDLARIKAEAQVNNYRSMVLFAVGAVAFALTALITLFFTITLALATLIGPLGGGLVASLIAAGIAAFLALEARKRMGAKRE